MSTPIGAKMGNAEDPGDADVALLQVALTLDDESPDSCTMADGDFKMFVKIGRFEITCKPIGELKFVQRRWTGTLVPRVPEVALQFARRGERFQFSLPPCHGVGTFESVPERARPIGGSRPRRISSDWTIRTNGPVDAVFRAAAAALTLILTPYLLVMSIFITDPGTSDAIRVFYMVVAGLLLGGPLLLGLIAWPQKVERFLPGPSWLGVMLVRGPIYALVVALGSVLVWSQLQSLMGLISME